MQNLVAPPRQNKAQKKEARQNRNRGCHHDRQAGFTQPNLMDTSIVLVPILGPLVGGALGAFVYDMTTGALNKDPDAAFCEDGAQACES